nr:nuclear transport factor 2 family protein [Sphingomonas sp. Y57]
MQYSSELTRERLISLARDEYFANVDAGNIDAAVACFHPEALFTVQTSFATITGTSAIREMIERLVTSNEKVVHRDFVFTVDEANGRIAASFTVELTGKDGTNTVMQNTNFWRVRGDKFQEVYVYMSGSNVLG